MRIVLQRVSYASVKVEGEITGKINQGLLLLVGFAANDTIEQMQTWIDKVLKLRIFSDEQGKMNLSVQDVQGGLLVVSQFTLYADTRKGNRPSFIDAAPPAKAKELYEEFLVLCTKSGLQTEAGIFGADMKVELLNDGPVTITLGDY
jgi:D-tyrosyl-tRNA(Tyr) deacylase